LLVSCSGWPNAAPVETGEKRQRVGLLKRLFGSRAESSHSGSPDPEGAKKAAYREFEKGLASALVAEHRPTAEGHFRAAIAIKPDEGVFQLRLAATLEAMGRRDEARAEYGDAARLMPGEGAADFCLGNMARDEGNVVSAREHYVKALRLSLEPPFDAACAQALRELREKSSAPAVTDLPRAQALLADLETLWSKLLEVANRISKAGPVQGEFMAVIVLLGVFNVLKQEIGDQFTSLLEEAREIFPFHPQIQAFPALKLGPPNRGFDVHDIPLVSAQQKEAAVAISGLLKLVHDEVRPGTPLELKPPAA
jgi:tetratricopeptide (TPR) repeat protein